MKLAPYLQLAIIAFAVVGCNAGSDAGNTAPLSPEQVRANLDKNPSVPDAAKAQADSAAMQNKVNQMISSGQVKPPQNQADFEKLKAQLQQHP